MAPQVPGFPSGTYNWGNASGGPPIIMELVAEAYERCGKIGVELTSMMIQSARRSLNLVLSSWANTGPNLWTIDEVAHYMPPNVGQYYDDASCVNIMADSVVLRQYQMGAPVAVAPAFSTITGSRSVVVAGLSATPSAGQYITVGVMTSIGGVIVDGFYQVQSVPGSGQAMITAAAAATATVTGGVVPQFVTTANSNTVTVNLPNHGLLTGQSFNVEVQTSVGGITLLGPYAVTAVNNASQFTITSPFPAGSAATISENGGNTNLSTQASNTNGTNPAYPVDILLYALSRGEWEAIPVKNQPGRPSTFWIDRQIVPVINVWEVPNSFGPYELRYWRSRQVQDADIVGGQTLAVPYRLLAAFVYDLSAHLAVKWAPERATALAQIAEAEKERAFSEDREKVSSFLVPDLSGYFE